MSDERIRSVADVEEAAESVAATIATSSTLTREMLERAVQEIRDAQCRICGVTEPHVVHPNAEGWTICATCFCPVEVETDEHGRKRIVTDHHPQ